MTMSFGLAEELINTSRTCVLGDLFFLSRGHADIWGTDATYCFRRTDLNFSYVSTVCEEDARAVMPSAARIGDRIVVALRP
jgi:hypothetical protein